MAVSLRTCGAIRFVKRHRASDTELQAAIDMVARGTSFRAACQKLGITHYDAWKRVTGENHFVNEYSRARQASGDLAADRVMSVSKRAENGEVDPHAARTAMWGYGWYAERANRRAWGSKVDVEHSGSIEETKRVVIDVRGLDDGARRVLGALTHPRAGTDPVVDVPDVISDTHTRSVPASNEEEAQGTEGAVLPELGDGGGAGEGTDESEPPGSKGADQPS